MESSANDDGFETNADLLGGFTRVMSHFYVVVATETVSAVQMSPSIADSASSADAFRALSEAFHSAANVTNPRSTATPPGNLHLTPKSRDIESERRATTDSILWHGEPSLLSLLSDIAAQVCAVDSGAGAKLIDFVLGLLPVKSWNIASLMTRVSQSLSVSATEMLSVVLPAAAEALGQSVEQPMVSDRADIRGNMENVIWSGNAFITEVMGSMDYFGCTDLHDMLNHVASLMCAAADHLLLPICIISTKVSSVQYQIVVPCGCLSSQSNPNASEATSSHGDPGKMSSSPDFTVATMSSADGYSFSTFSLPSAPSYGQDASSKSQSEAPQYERPTALPSSSTSITIPAYSTRSGQISNNVLENAEYFPNLLAETNTPEPYNMPDAPAATSTRLVCSCNDDAAPSPYQSIDNDCTSTPQSYGTAKGMSSTTTNCVTSSTSSIISDIAEYSQATSEPDLQPVGYGEREKAAVESKIAYSGIVWRYLGCYGDAPDRTLQAGGTDSFYKGDVSRQKCVDYCTPKGYSLSGTEDGQECFCGNSLTTHARRLPETACSTPCQGEKGDSCGGAWAVSIYMQEKQMPGGTEGTYRSLADLVAARQAQRKSVGDPVA